MKTTQWMLLIIGMLTILHIQPSEITFEEQWHYMQQEYVRVSKEIEINELTSLEETYLHPYWIKKKEEIKKFIQDVPSRNFLEYGPIGGTMVHRGMGIPQVYEICYLQHCVSQATKEKINLFKESAFGLLTPECSEFNCSSNTLTHLFYSAKILESSKDIPINTILEFGSGYGNLAHIFKTILPDATIFLIDLPEFLALQGMFLRASMPNTPIYFHSELPQHYEQKAIHLIPVHFIEQLSVEVDLFVSTMALSETTHAIQKIVSQKDFFNAPLCYITGQINGWGTEHNFVNHDLLIENVTRIYKNVYYQPAHFILNNLLSYELVAKNSSDYS